MDSSDVMNKLQTWLAQNGPLSEANVFDYFRASPFYNTHCGYEQLLSQGLAPTPERLEQFAGPVYTVLRGPPSTPPVFVICESVRARAGDAATRPCAYYAVVDATITRAPTLLALLAASLRKCIHYTAQAFDTLRDAVAVDPVHGRVWDPADIPDPVPPTPALLAELAAGPATAGPAAVHEPPPPPPLPPEQALAPQELDSTVCKMLEMISQVRRCSLLAPFLECVFMLFLGVAPNADRKGNECRRQRAAAAAAGSNDVMVMWNAMRERETTFSFVLVCE